LISEISQPTLNLKKIKKFNLLADEGGGGVEELCKNVLAL